MRATLEESADVLDALNAEGEAKGSDGSHDTDILATLEL